LSKIDGSYISVPATKASEESGQHIMSQRPQAFSSSFFLFSSLYMHLAKYSQQYFYIAPHTSNVSIFFLV